MAKKAKKTSAKKTSTTKKSISPKVVTKVVSTKSSSKNGFKKLIDNRKKINDINGIFSAKTIAMLFVELIGAMVLTIAFVTMQAQNQLYMFFIMFGLIAGLGAISVTLFNPIISFGAWAVNKISAKKMVLTIVAQILGVMLAVIVLQQFFNANEKAQMALKQGNEAAKLFKMPMVSDKIEWLVVATEFLGSFVFALFVARSWKKEEVAKSVIVSGGFLIALSISSFLFLTAGIKATDAINLLNPSLLVALIDTSAKEINWTNVIAFYTIVPLFAGALGFLFNELLDNNKVKTTIK